MTHRVAFVVFDGCTLLDVSGPSEVLHQATRRGFEYEVTLVSARGGAVRTADGLVLGGIRAAAAAGPADTVIVSGGERLATRPIEDELLTATAALAETAGRVAAICTGAFVPARLGWLDGRRATTHWRHARTLAARYPSIRVEPDAIHIADGRYLTSAGITAGIDLTLAVVEHDHGAAVARDIARELVVYMQRPGGQSQFSAALAIPPARSEVLRQLTAAVLSDPAGEHGLGALADRAVLSTRHLTRLFQAEFGLTPARWVELVRLDRAKQLLLDGYSVTAAAERSGLGTDETLRRVFARHLDTTPTAYRQRFATTGY
ncbi:GlxA family transcriptional regulator [Nocardia yamanashiensis]|uniref:GlxA family transcriptional regulator n=1 Tax=Nocardia yamanashiensis TaxID=209247 RepID=UPI000835F44B|nr:helix-turn-helix domain-containing protein [Nocardia yamanashiensis]